MEYPSATPSSNRTPPSPVTLRYPTTSDDAVGHLTNGMPPPCSSIFYYFRTATDSLFTDGQHITRELVDSSAQMKLTTANGTPTWYGS